MEPELNDQTTLTAAAIPAPGTELTLAGPCARVDPLRRPVRGDLAHIRCAGTVFVPHYAVPMPRTVAAGGATLRKTMQAEGEALAELAAGTAFQMLDISGGWAWGQVGGVADEDGLVGYVPLDKLEDAA